MLHDLKSSVEQLREQYGERISIGDNCDLASDVHLAIADDSNVHIGNRVTIGRGTTIIANDGGAIIHIDDDVAIGEHVYVSAMSLIYIGKGVGISNMVDLHDHNHRDRSFTYLPSEDLTTYHSGFESAPIIIESGAIISNKCSVTAGVRIGQNTKVGANTVVSKSIGHNSIAIGSPAKVLRTFAGPMNREEPRIPLRVGFFGTSIMEHYEAYSSALYIQANLPQIGSQVMVESWVKRGYAHQLYRSLQVTWPHLTFHIENYGSGGATSRDILSQIQDVLAADHHFDIAFFGCGINDVWRHFQGRTAEEVGIEEYNQNYQRAIKLLVKRARKTICVSEPPFGLPDAEEMNTVLHEYNNVARTTATQAGVAYLDIWTAFQNAVRESQAWKEDENKRISFWSSDLVHLSEFGDALITEHILSYLREHAVIQSLLTYPRLDRHQVNQHYRDLIKSLLSHTD